MKHTLSLICSFLFLCLMLLMPSLTLEGSRQGLILWFQNLLPALFPYMILSSLILGLDRDSKLTGWLSPVSTRLFRISGNGCFAILTGVLCGYPLGAKITAQMIRAKKISVREGQYLISFCNMASPGFLIQYVTAQSLGSLAYLRPMFFSVYGASFLTMVFLQPLYRRSLKTGGPGSLHTPNKRSAVWRPQPEKRDDPAEPSDADTQSFSVNEAIMDSFEAMVRLCGYMVLFSIIAKMVTARFSTVTTSKNLLIGIIEITNGVHYITENIGPLSTKLLLLSFCVSFGGISCFAQSAGMCQHSGLSMPVYLASKLLCASFSMLLMLLWCAKAGLIG